MREPVLVSHLLKMYNRLDITSSVDVQFWAACLVMFRALLRISNVVGVHALHCRDVQFTDWGALLFIRSSKCSDKMVHIIPIAKVQSVSLCAVFWLRLVMSGNCTGLVFAQLSYRKFQVKLRKLCKMCRISARLSSHSFRSGGATFMSAEGVPIEKIKERGGWRSSCVYRYINEPLAYRIANEKKFSLIF